MLPYGEKKRKNKLHDFDECSICSEKNISKGSERQKVKREIKKETDDFYNPEITTTKIKLPEGKVPKGWTFEVDEEIGTDIEEILEEED